MLLKAKSEPSKGEAKHRDGRGEKEKARDSDDDRKISSAVDEMEKQLAYTKEKRDHSPSNPAMTLKGRGSGDKMPMCPVCRGAINDSYRNLAMTHHCHMYFSPIEDNEQEQPYSNSIVFKKIPVVTNVFLEKLARLISPPFAAVGLLIDNIVKLEATTLYIDLCEPDASMKNEAKLQSNLPNSNRGKNSSGKYLRLIDNGMIWSCEDFVDIIDDF